jgi:hypothetical protein
VAPQPRRGEVTGLRPGQVSAALTLSAMREQPRSTGSVDRNGGRTDQHDQLSTLWQELAETVARAQRLVNEQPKSSSPEQHH